MNMSHLWEELTSAQLADRLAVDPDCVALIPVGATEQHGPHLPVGTDIIIATALGICMIVLAMRRGRLVQPSWMR